MRLNIVRNAVLMVAAVAGLTMFGGTAQAQMPALHPSFYGTAEADTRSTQFYLLGMYVGMGGLGWSPYFNVNANALHYEVLGESRTLSAVAPTLGLAYAARNRGVSIGAGYAWVHNPDVGAPGAETGGSDGVTASLGAYQNGAGRRRLRTQLLANYNFGAEYLWARARASRPFGRSTRHPTRLGLELVGQGGGKKGRTSSVFEFGPTFEYAWTPSFRTTGAVGYKNVGGTEFPSRENAAYFKLEFSLSP
jgi:hypothetical protein